MINEKQTMYLAVVAIILATLGIGLSYYKATGPIGPEGPAGPIGAAGPTGPAGPAGETGVVTVSAEPESCVTCHDAAGDAHQDAYDELFQDGVITVSDITYTYTSGAHKVAFKMTMDGEAIDANIELIVTITEGIPVLDMMQVKQYLQKSNSRLIGPNCPGIITPGECKVGIMPSQIYMPGKVGVISRSSTLSYEVVSQLSAREIGQSSCVGLGADYIHGVDFIDVLKLFEDDPETEPSTPFLPQSALHTARPCGPCHSSQ